MEQYGNTQRYTLPDKEKMEQEQRSLVNTGDGFKKIIITKDAVAPLYNDEGILVMSVYDFLLNPDSMENTNGTSPYLEIDTDHRVTEICDTLSIGAAIQNILLTATELGYGTLWIANTCFAYNELVDFMSIKGQLVGAISLGIADEAPEQRPRKDFSEVVEFR